MFFSEQLKQKYIMYVQRKYGLLISDAEANEHLDSLSGLYLAFSGDVRSQDVPQFGGQDASA